MITSIYDDSSHYKCNHIFCHPVHVLPIPQFFTNCDTRSTNIQERTIFAEKNKYGGYKRE